MTLTAAQTTSQLTTSPPAAPTPRDPVAIALQELLDGRWVDVRESCRRAADDPLFEPVYDLDRAAYCERVLGQARRIAELGLPLLGMPTSVGGQNDVGASVTGFEMLAYGDLSLMVKAGVQWGLFGGAILHLGTERHHERYLRAVATLDLPGCFAMTETGHGSDVASIRTTATYDADSEEFVITTPDRSAYKDYIGNAARHGRLAVVFAQLATGGDDQGVHAFLVPIRDEDGAAHPGVTIEDCGPKAGLNGVDNGRLAFAAVRIPRENLLDRYGSVAPDGIYSTEIPNRNARFFTMLGTLIQGRISVAGGAASAGKLALAIAVRYGETRRQFAAPGSQEEVVLLDYRTHQRRLLPLLATSYALSFAQADLVERLHAVFSEETTGAPSDPDAKRRLESDAAGIKALTTWHAVAATQTAREACGGAGYLAENRIAALRADSDVFTTFEGDNTVLLQLVGKEMLGGLQRGFGRMDRRSRARFVAARLADTAADRTGARGVVRRVRDARPGGSHEVFDRAFQRDLFEARHEHVLNLLARQMRRVDSKGPDAFAGFNAVQDQLVHAGRVQVERAVLQAFDAAIADCPDPAAAALLNTVCDLYALSIIEGDRAWFVEHGFLTPRRSRALRGVVNGLCAELRPHALTLVDGLGIPAAALSAPIAHVGAGSRGPVLTRK